MKKDLTGKGRQLCVSACLCMCGSMYGCLPPFLICAQNLWQPVTVAFLFLTPNLSFPFFVSYDNKKTATSEATSCFLDLVLSLQMYH